MQFFFVLIQEHLTLFITLFLGAIFVIFYVLKNKGKEVCKENEKGSSSFSSAEYDDYCKLCLAAIENTTISFDSTLSNEFEHPYDLYDRTIIVGNRLIKEESFKISKVGSI